MLRRAGRRAASASSIFLRHGSFSAVSVAAADLSNESFASRYYLMSMPFKCSGASRILPLRGQLFKSYVRAIYLTRSVNDVRGLDELGE